MKTTIPTIEPLDRVSQQHTYKVWHCDLEQYFAEFRFDRVAFVWVLNAGEFGAMNTLEVRDMLNHFRALGHTVLIEKCAWCEPSNGETTSSTGAEIQTTHRICPKCLASARTEIRALKFAA